MMRTICRRLKPIHHQISHNNLNTLSMRNATLLFEMRSGRVGKIKLDSQKEFDKILERLVFKFRNFLLIPFLIHSFLDIINNRNFCKIRIVFICLF